MRREASTRRTAVAPRGEGWSVASRSASRVVPGLAALLTSTLIVAGGAAFGQESERDEPHAQPMPVELQRQAEKRVAEYEPRLRQLVRTEDEGLNALVETIYRECVYGKLFEPMPPELPYRWFAPGGAYFTGQWIWDTMFVLIAFAPLDDDAVVRESFDNYRHTIENNPLAPAGSIRYGMVPDFMGARELRKDGEAWPPVGYSQIPILGWGALSVYRQTNDRALIEQVLPWLVAFDEWYSTERDVDGDGLIEYGAHETVGSNTPVQTARFETFDFHLPLDDMKLTRHPGRETGEPLGVPGLGMSGVVWSMIVHNLYGVQEDYRTIRVPEGAAGRSLKLGKLNVSYPEDHVVELRSGFDRSIRVVFADETGAGEPRVTVGGAAGESEPPVTVEGGPWPSDASENDVRFVAKAGETYRVERSPSRP